MLGELEQRRRGRDGLTRVGCELGCELELFLVAETRIHGGEATAMRTGDGAESWAVDDGRRDSELGLRGLGTGSIDGE